MPCRRGLFIILVAFIITLNLLPAWNIHIVPESWRKAFHFRYAWLVRETEYEIWSNTNRTPEQKKEEALALKKHFRPGDSIVAGKIGLLGYYSGLRVYDRNGLVDKRVWMRHSSRKLGTPGHDTKVSTDFFFPDDPTIVAHGRITGKTQHELLQKIKSQAHVWRNLAIWKRYVPALLPLKRSPDGSDNVLIVLRLIEGEPPHVKTLPRPERVAFQGSRLEPGLREVPG